MTTFSTHTHDRHDHDATTRSIDPENAPIIEAPAPGMTSAELTRIKAMAARSLTNARSATADLFVQLDFESPYECILGEVLFERQGGLSHINAERMVATTRVEGATVGLWTYGAAIAKILSGGLDDETRAQLVQPVAPGWVRILVIARESLAIVDSTIDELQAAQADDELDDADGPLHEELATWLDTDLYLPADAATRWVHHEAARGLIECVTPSGVGFTLAAREVGNERVLRVALWCETSDEPPTTRQLAEVLDVLRWCGPFRELWHYALPNPRSTALVEARISNVVLQ